MRSLFPIILLLLMASSSSAQDISIESLLHDNLTREFVVYVPESYTGDEAVPLLFNFHGYTSGPLEQMGYGDFRAIADREGFILIHPQGTLHNGNPHFNVGGFTIGSTTDDVGFTNAMINFAIDNYTIDTERIYSTGMSNGGYMSFLLACDLSERIAAVASVTGSMTPETIDGCNSSHPMPILQIHGTDDSVVPYSGAAWTLSIDDVIDYWVEQNECSTDFNVESIENTNTSDGSTAEIISYNEGLAGSKVVHIKIDGADHTWPGTKFVSRGTNLDFDASEVIWEFFSAYDINGLRETTNTAEVDLDYTAQIHPNPADHFIEVESFTKGKEPYLIVDISGNTLAQGTLKSQRQKIDTHELEAGIYFIKIANGWNKFLIAH